MMKNLKSVFVIARNAQFKNFEGHTFRGGRLSTSYVFYSYSQRCKHLLQL
jgi:hypothetical protein